MNIEKALLALRNGYSIYRSSWDNGLYVYLNNNVLTDQDGEKTILEISDLKNDWGICDLHLFTDFKPGCLFSFGEITPRYKVVFSNDDFFVYSSLYSKDPFVQSKYDFEDFAIKVNLLMKG